MSNYITLLIAACLMAILGLGIWIVKKDIRNPALLYTIVWTLILLLNSLSIIKYPETSSLTLVIVGMSALVFCFSSMIGSAIPWFAYKDRVSEKEAGRYLPSVGFIITLVIVGISAGLYYYQSKFGLSVLLTNPGYVRFADRDGSGFYGFLLLLPSFSVIVLALRWLLTRENPWLTGIVVLLAYSYFAILPERTTVIANTLWILGIWIILDKGFRKKISKYLVVAVSGFAILLVFFIVVNNRTGKNTFFDGIGYAVNYQDFPGPLVSPYIYITGSLPALSTLVSDPSTPNFDYKLDRTAFPVARIVQLLSNNEGSKLSESEDAAFIPFYFNTYTWLSLPIRDQGIIGSQLYVFIVGLLTGLLYRAAVVTRKPLWAFLYGGVFSAVLLSGMTNRFSSLTWWVAAAFGFLVLASPQSGWRIKGIKKFRLVGTTNLGLKPLKFRRQFVLKSRKSSGTSGR